MNSTFVVQYGYLIGSLLGGLVWLGFFLLRKDLRKEMIWMSLFVTLWGFTEPFFLKTYWNPGYLFGIGSKIGFGVEDIIFSFFFGGIAGVSYEVLARKGLKRIATKGDATRFAPIIIMFVLFFVLAQLGLNVHLYSYVFPFTLAGVFIGIKRHDLIKESIFGGVSFAFTYLLLGVVFLSFFPTYIQDVYNTKNLWGVYIGGFPLEEVIFAFATGTGFAPLYEYVMGYKLVRVRSSSF